MMHFNSKVMLTNDSDYSCHMNLFNQIAIWGLYHASI